MPQDTRAAVVSGGNVQQWGDPYTSFVGNVYGSEPNFSGYGVYYPPVAAAARQYGANAVAGTGWTVASIEAQVQQGNAVIAWVNRYFEPSGVRYWTAWDGRSVPYTTEEHTVVVVGFDTGAGTVTVLDVANGTRHTFSEPSFAAMLTTFNGMAVAVSQRSLSPAVATLGNGTKLVFWEGTDQNLWEDVQSGSSQQVRSLGMGPLGSGPSTAVLANGDVEVFWKGTENNLWEAREPGGVGGAWQGPIYRGMGPLNSPPAATAWGSETDVFWEGTDWNLWEAWWQSSAAPHGPQTLGMGALGSMPTAASHSSGEQDVFWMGTDQALWEGYWNGTRWQGPMSLGMGPLGSQPAVAADAGGNEQDVVWEGTDRNIWEGQWVGNAWRGPSPRGMGPLGSAPAIARSGTDVDVFWQGADHNLWGAVDGGGSWSGPTGYGDGPLG
jgi:hypothetical protein